MPFVILESYHTCSTWVDHAVITLGSSVVATEHQYFKIHMGNTVNYQYSVPEGSVMVFFFLLLIAIYLKAMLTHCKGNLYFTE